MAIKPWDPDLSKGLHLTQFSVFVFFLFFNPVLTQVWIGSPFFSQSITQGDTLRESDWDARMMPRGICDTHPTLVYTPPPPLTPCTPHPQEKKGRTPHSMMRLLFGCMEIGTYSWIPILTSPIEVGSGYQYLSHPSLVLLFGLLPHARTINMG
jgi:hypothetical protein